MKRRRRRLTGVRKILGTTRIDPQSELWILRATLYRMKYLDREYGRTKAKRCNSIESLLDLDSDEQIHINPRELTERLREIEQRGAKRDSPLYRNVGRVARDLGLDKVEREVLLLAVCLHVNSTLAGRVGKVLMMCVDSPDSLASALGFILQVEPGEVRTAIAQKGRLAGYGLLRYAPAGEGSLSFALKEMPLVVPAPIVRILANNIIDEDKRLIDYFVSRCRPPDLCKGDFRHFADEMELIGRYLANAARRRIKGVNVLLYGPPGTGKTQLARLLAHEVAEEAFEVPRTLGKDDLYNERLETVDDRLIRYRIAQALAPTNHACVIVFDEAESLLADPLTSLMFAGEPASDKASMTELLEANRVPTIWISNRVQHMDKAFLRRFQLAFEMKVPPPRVRLQIFERALGNTPHDSRTVRRLASLEGLSPADLERAAEVVRVAGYETPEEVGKALERLLEEDDLRKGRRTRYAFDPARHDLSLLNTSVDLNVMIASLSRRKKGKFLLYGQPGTGKTAFVHAVAYELGLPLVLKSAADLLRPYVGETEGLIAQMFEEEVQEEVVLFLDESDSLFWSRKNASESWQVSQVNELLNRMERYEGIFFCATNQVDLFDDAAYRRFTAKIEFKPLTSEGRRKMLEYVLDALGSHQSPEELRALRPPLDSLAGLTIGDFVAVKRRLEFCSECPSAREVLDALAEELTLRTKQRPGSLGFRK